MRQGLFSSLPLLTVSQVNRYILQLMDSDEILSDIRVSGEISNFTRAASGHLYFSLKDGQSALRVVMWKSSALRLRFQPRNGQLIEAEGRVGVYERDGAYQLYADRLKPAGEGALYQEFMRLKAELETRSLFDPARKRALPVFPQRIGVVTSPAGAALQDILNTLARRYPLAEVILSPSAVQGEGAAEELVRALRRLFRREEAPDVIILARGGGSIEDLWAFNDQVLVETVAASPIPIISGVGHETDITLVDFAADLRAPTPTAAAEHATPDRAELALSVQGLSNALNAAARRRLATLRQLLDFSGARLERQDPLQRLSLNRQMLDGQVGRLYRAAGYNVRSGRAEWRALTARLVNLDPLSLLRRGYAIVDDADGVRISSISQVKPAAGVRVRLHDGSIDARVERIRVNDEETSR